MESRAVFPAIAGCLLATLWMTTALAQAGGDAVAIGTAERDTLVSGIGEKLANEYIDPAVAKKMADAIRARARRGEYAAIAGGQALADKLTADLREVSHDGHLWVAYHPEGARDEPIAPTIAEMDGWREGIARDNFAFDKVERLQGNVGYVRFRIFAYPHLAAETATAAMTFVAHADALIIDLRDNMGGDPDMVAYLASYLFDERTHLNDMLYRKDGRLQQYWTAPVPGQVFGGTKPVYVLTSHGTFSAAEDFSYALQNLKRARIVGEKTGGGAHPSREFRVSEHFAAAIPYARSISPVTHGDWEGEGVAPDIEVPADRAFDVAYRAALEGIAATTADPGRKAAMQQLLDEQARAKPIASP
jgi:hypothetical protein